MGFQSANLTNVKVKALSLLIKTFLETALSDKFQKNLFHEAIFRWYVLKERDLVKPMLPPYYSHEMLDIITSVREEGMLNIKTRSYSWDALFFVEDAAMYNLNSR